MHREQPWKSTVAWRWVAALCAVALALPGAAVAQERPPESGLRLVVPLPEAGVAPFGRGWSLKLRRFVSVRGACVDYDTTSFAPAPRVRITLKTLSRAGGHFLVGLHVAREQGVETLEAARLNDAARRLAHRDKKAFRELCGDVFVAATVTGSQFVGELEVDGRQGNAAFAWLRARGFLGASEDVEGVTKVLEHFAKQFAPEARWFPGGQRAEVETTSAEALIAGARAFPESEESKQGRAYLALLVDYNERMLTGLASEFTLPPPEEPGRAVFAAMRPRRGKASEMLLARSERRPPPAPRPRPPVFRVERVPVRALQMGATTVYAGASELPDHYVERVGATWFWVPGAAAGTPRVRNAIAAAIASDAIDRAPLVWVRRYATGDATGRAVYFSPDAPAAGIFGARGGEGYAWLPGVSAPSTREQALLENVINLSETPASPSGAPDTGRPRR